MMMFTIWIALGIATALLYISRTKNKESKRAVSILLTIGTFHALADHANAHVPQDYADLIAAASQVGVDINDPNFGAQYSNLTENEKIEILKDKLETLDPEAKNAMLNVLVRLKVEADVNNNNGLGSWIIARDIASLTGVDIKKVNLTIREEEYLVFKEGKYDGNFQALLRYGLKQKDFSRQVEWIERINTSVLDKKTRYDGLVTIFSFNVTNKGVSPLGRYIIDSVLEPSFEKDSYILESPPQKIGDNPGHRGVLKVLAEHSLNKKIKGKAFQKVSTTNFKHIFSIAIITLGISCVAAKIICRD